jgi:hypothetical protein
VETLHPESLTCNSSRLFCWLIWNLRIVRHIEGWVANSAATSHIFFTEEWQDNISNLTMTVSFQIVPNELFISQSIIPWYTAKDNESTFKYPPSRQILTWRKGHRTLQESTAIHANVPTTSEAHRIRLGSLTAGSYNMTTTGTSSGMMFIPASSCPQHRSL